MASGRPSSPTPPPNLPSSKKANAVISYAELCPYNVFGFQPRLKILYAVKLAYVFGKTGMIVTTEDHTYSNGLVGGAERPTLVLTKIPQLCGKNIKDFISGSDHHCFALTTPGEIYSWGTTQSELSESLLPIKIGGGVDGKAIIQVASFSNFVLALDADGVVYSWGCNAQGQLGLGSTTRQSAPTAVPEEFFNKQKIVRIAVAEDMSAAMSETGQLFKWGHGVTRPKMVNCCGTAIAKIFSGMTYVRGLSNTGKVYSIGQGEPRKADVAQLPNTLDIGADVKVGMIAYRTTNGIMVNGLIGGGAGEAWSPSCFFSMDHEFATWAQITYRTLTPRDDGSGLTFNQDLAKAWDEKTNYDVTFRVENQMIQAHKGILGMKSKYFESMFAKQWTEGSDEVIDIQDTMFSTFQSLLYHIYHDEFDFEDTNFTEAARLMKLANAYCEFGIGGKCERILIQNADISNVIV